MTKIGFKVDPQWIEACGFADEDHLEETVQQIERLIATASGKGKPTFAMTRIIITPIIYFFFNKISNYPQEKIVPMKQYFYEMVAQAINMGLGKDLKLEKQLNRSLLEGPDGDDDKGTLH